MVFAAGAFERMKTLTTPSFPPSSIRRAARPGLAVLGVTALLLGSGCSADDGGGSPQEQPSGSQSVASSDGPGESQDDSFTILSAGDVLPHTAGTDAAELPEGGWDFTPLMAGTQDWVSGADLALCSMEVPLVAPGQSPSGYPLFGAPAELIEGLREIGFDGCNTANNHSFDGGIGALENTLETFDAQGMGHVGTARTAEEADAAQMYTMERDGREVTVAHLSTTTLHNGSPLPVPEEPWRVTDVGPEELSAQAAQARQDGADIVVASVHWGDEYVHTPGEGEIAYAEELAAGGEVDLVFGNHSHTPQPIEELDGGPGDDGMWVVWSMGNFLSNQDVECCTMETATGTMTMATVEAPEDGPARVSGVEWTPVTNDRDGATMYDEVFRGIWAMADLMEDGAPIEELPGELDAQTVQQRFDRVVEVVGEEGLRMEAPEQTWDPPRVQPRE